jgi:hypothetical protein
VFSRDGKTLFHLRGSSLPQVWALDIATGADRQLSFHDEKVALLRRSPLDDRLIYGIDRGGDERQQLLLLDPHDPALEARKLTDNPAVIHDFGALSPDATRVAYAANERDEAHFDVYVQDIASGAGNVFTKGTIWSACPAFVRWRVFRLLHDRGFGDMSLLLSIGIRRCADIRIAEQLQSVRWSSDGRTLSALTDHGGSGSCGCAGWIRQRRCLHRQ